MRRTGFFQLLFLVAAALFLALAFPAPVGAETPPADVFSYRLTLEGAPLQLPCPMRTLTDAGWQTAVADTESFGAGLYGRVSYQKEGAGVTAIVANLGQQPALLGDCTLIGLAAAANESNLELAGGLSLGADRPQVLTVCGAPDRPLYGSGLGDEVAAPGAPNAEPEQAADTTADTLRYTTGRHSYVQFTFDDENRLTGVEMQNTEALPAPPDPAALPAEVQAWVPPAKPSVNWQSYTLEYAGALYTLPAPVSAFLQNGWQLRDEATLQAGRWLMGVRLQKGNQTLRTRVQNFSGEAAGLSGCFVTAVESSSVGADVPILLPGGISRSSTRAEIEAAWGPPHGTHQSVTHLTWLYYGPNGKITCQFWGQGGELYALTVEHLSLVDEPAADTAAG